jgi:tryptophan synthase alpha chain
LGKPFVVGFGISTPEDAKAIASIADGVVVGSAIVRGIGAAKSLDEAKAFTRAFIRDLKAAISD